MFLPRFSTRTVLIILAVAGLLFAILSQGITGVVERWKPTTQAQVSPSMYLPVPGETSAWYQLCAAVSVAAVALAMLMALNAVFFFIGWLLSWVSSGLRPEGDDTAAAPEFSPQEHPAAALAQSAASRVEDEA